jgi:hypothetical protein
MVILFHLTIYVLPLEYALFTSSSGYDITIASSELDISDMSTMTSILIILAFGGEDRIREEFDFAKVISSD